MSGPLSADDVAPVPEVARATLRHVVLEPGRRTTVGDLPVRRVLPQRPRRTVGAWCFADHMGPVRITEQRGVDIGPPPHLGLQTVTWLVSGEVHPTHGKVKRGKTIKIAFLTQQLAELEDISKRPRIARLVPVGVAEKLSPRCRRWPRRSPPRRRGRQGRVGERS